MIQYKVQAEKWVVTATIMTQIIYRNGIQYAHNTNSYSKNLFTAWF